MRRGRPGKSILKIAAVCFVFILLLQAFPYGIYAENSPISGIQTSSVFTEEEPPAYSQYLSSYAAAEHPQTKIVVTAENISPDSKGITLKSAEESAAGSVLTEEDSFATWKFSVPQAGLYNLVIRYFPEAGKGGDINRVLYLDGKIPFAEAKFLTIRRIWKEEYSGNKTDANGNDVLPNEVEVKRWNEVAVCDSTGYIADPLSVYLTAGDHTVSLKSEREPLLIESLCFMQAEQVKSYAEVLTDYQKNGYRAAKTNAVYFQAENMAEKSSRSIYPLNDRDSEATQPQDIFKTKLNYMGGNNWKNAGLWVSWKIKAEKSGLYKIVPRYRQNFYSGTYSSRKLLIDGKLPFQEAALLKFDYNSDWVTKPLGDEKNGDYLFYFEAGREYELSMEVVLGEMGEILTRADKILEGLNQCYRDILMITGTTPDSNRDYNFEEVIPDTLKELKEQKEQLAAVSEQMVKTTGMHGERVTTLDQLVFLLDKMGAEPSDIGKLFNRFKDNLSSLGSWILTTSQQPLALDYFALVPGDGAVPKANGGFLKKLAFGFGAFLASFTTEYDAGQEDTDKADTVTVWLSTGRDQYTVIRRLIDGSFTPESKIAVRLQLVGAGTLLPSVLTGRGPDVSLSNAIDSTVSIENPIDFAVRHAVTDLSEFEDFGTVAKRFYDSALVPYRFMGGVYALPETQSFHMMFVRTDVFGQLGLAIPSTWEELDRIIPELQKKNMSIGIPHDLNALLMLMYQRNTPLYLKDGARTNLDSSAAIRCFQKLTEYFTLYNLPTDYDFYNRFRSGEIPIAIQDYTAYNQLTLFAPEIRGNWIMTTVPGTMDENGEIHHTTTAKGTAVMMLTGVKNKQAAWEFMKWWTSAEIQSGFTVQMQAMLNSAMQATANKEALAMLPWTVNDYRNIEAQWKTVEGTPEVPGGYYTARIVNFAFNEVYNTKKDPGDTLQSYIDQLNSELTRKRNEFGIKEGE